jgi:hypothetical protein
LAKNRTGTLRRAALCSRQSGSHRLLKLLRAWGSGAQFDVVVVSGRCEAHGGMGERKRKRRAVQLNIKNRSRLMLRSRAGPLFGRGKQTVLQQITLHRALGLPFHRPMRLIYTSDELWSSALAVTLLPSCYPQARDEHRTSALHLAQLPHSELPIYLNACPETQVQLAPFSRRHKLFRFSVLTLLVF